MALEKAGERAVLITYGSQVDDMKTACLQKFKTKVATAAGHVPPMKLPTTSDAARFHSHRFFLRVQAWKGNYLSPNEWRWARSSVNRPCSCADVRPSSPRSEVIVVSDVIHDIAPTSRTAFSALHRAVNARALRVKTLCKWIVRILMTLPMMLSETNDTANNNCYLNLNLL